MIEIILTHQKVEMLAVSALTLPALAGGVGVVVEVVGEVGGSQQGSPGHEVGGERLCVGMGGSAAPAWPPTEGGAAAASPASTALGLAATQLVLVFS